jgi:hypothetical protein
VGLLSLKQRENYGARNSDAVESNCHVLTGCLRLRDFDVHPTLDNIAIAVELHTLLTPRLWSLDHSVSSYEMKVT